MPCRALLLAALALPGLALLGGCTRTAPPGLPPGDAAADAPEAEAWDARLRLSTDGRPTVELDAPYLARLRQGDSATVYLGPPPGESDAAEPADARIDRVSVRLFDDAGALAASVTAARAWLAESDGRLAAEGAVSAALPGGGGARVDALRLTAAPDGAFTATGGATAVLSGPGATVRARTVSGRPGRYEATGGVTVEAAGGRRLEAGRVVWDEAAGRFSAPGAFSFDGPGERVRGVGLTATADLTRYSFRRASGQIEVRE